MGMEMALLVERRISFFRGRHTRVGQPPTHPDSLSSAKASLISSSVNLDASALAPSASLILGCPPCRPSPSPSPPRPSTSSDRTRSVA